MNRRGGRACLGNLLKNGKWFSIKHIMDSHPADWVPKIIHHMSIEESRFLSNLNGVVSFLAARRDNRKENGEIGDYLIHYFSTHRRCNLLLLFLKYSLQPV